MNWLLIQKSYKTDCAVFTVKYVYFTKKNLDRSKIISQYKHCECFSYLNGIFYQLLCHCGMDKLINRKMNISYLFSEH